MGVAYIFWVSVLPIVIRNNFVFKNAILTTWSVFTPYIFPLVIITGAVDFGVHPINIYVNYFNWNLCLGGETRKNF